MSNIKIENINVFDLEVPSYDEKELQLFTPITEDFDFNPNTDFIEAKIYDESKNFIYSSGDFADGGIYREYSVIKNDIQLNPEEFISNMGYNNGTYFIIYNFYRKICSDNNYNLKEFFISDIDSTRTELKIKLIGEKNDDIINSINNFIEYRKNTPKFIDFIVSFGENNIIANNIKIDNTQEELTLLIKLYEPLPVEEGINSQLLLLLEINNPQGYKISITQDIVEVDDSIPLSGPNFSIKTTGYSASDSEEMSLEDITGLSLLENTKYQLKSYLNDQKNKLNIDYSKFENFIHFSSAFKRFYNFIQKVKLLQLNDAIRVNSSEEYINSVSIRTNEDILESFDSYEYYLYYKIYPRDNDGNLIPFLQSPSIPESENNQINPLVVTWYNRYSEEALNYDENNLDNLYWNIPEYLREDPKNYPYRLFIEMIGHSFDDIWVYIKNLTKLYNGDNRSDVGISKDLLVKLLNNFGLKLYNGNYSTYDLYSSFLGNSSTSIGEFTHEFTQEFRPLDIEDGSDTPLDDLEYKIFKRLYHNLPYLYKGKGTVNVLRTLINIYGIPQTTLNILEFGDNPKITTNEGSIIGETLLPFESLQQIEYNNTIDNKFNKYVEVGISPQDNINVYLNSEEGISDVNQIIGDPRLFKTGGNKYLKLEQASINLIPEVIGSYSIMDYINFTKTLNNSLFKMLRDFVPANTVISSGIIIKQHILERNKTSPLDVDYEDITHVTTLKSAPRDYKEGDETYPSDDRKYGSSVEVTSGGTAGAPEMYNTIDNHPYYAGKWASEDVRDWNFGEDNLIQDWSQFHPSIVGLVEEKRDNQREFYDGEYGNDIIQKSPEICRAHFSNEYIKDYQYKVIFSGGPNDITSESSFLNTLPEENGIIEIFVENNVLEIDGKPPMPKYIKISRYSFSELNFGQGFDISSFIETNEFMNIYLDQVTVWNKDEEGNWEVPPEEDVSGSFKFTFYNVIQKYSSNNVVGYLIVLDQTRTDAVQGYTDVSNSGKTIFRAKGNYIWEPRIGDEPAMFRKNPQGYFPHNITNLEHREQFFRGYGDAGYLVGNNIIQSNIPVINPFGTFNKGTMEVDGDVYNTVYYTNYNETPPSQSEINKIPWFNDDEEGIIHLPLSTFKVKDTFPSGNSEFTFLGAEFNITKGISNIIHNIKTSFGINALTPVAQLESIVTHIDGGIAPPPNTWTSTPPSGVNVDILANDKLEITLKDAKNNSVNFEAGQNPSLMTKVLDKNNVQIAISNGVLQPNNKDLKLVIDLNNYPSVGKVETFAYRPNIIQISPNLIIGIPEITDTPGSPSLDASAVFSITVLNEPFQGKIKFESHGYRSPGGGSGNIKAMFYIFSGSPYQISKTQNHTPLPENGYYFSKIETVDMTSPLPIGEYTGIIQLSMTVSESGDGGSMEAEVTFLNSNGTIPTAPGEPNSASVSDSYP